MHEEIAHEEIAHEEIAHEEIAHEEVAHEETVIGGRTDTEIPTEEDIPEEALLICIIAEEAIAEEMVIPMEETVIPISPTPTTEKP